LFRWFVGVASCNWEQSNLPLGFRKKKVTIFDFFFRRQEIPLRQHGGNFRFRRRKSLKINRRSLIRNEQVKGSNPFSGSYFKAVTGGKKRFSASTVARWGRMGQEKACQNDPTFSPSKPLTSGA
jgi:hypothetical protein